MNKKIFVFLLILIIVFGVYYYFFRYRPLHLNKKIDLKVENLKDSSQLEALKEVKDSLFEKANEFKEEKIKDIEEKTNEFLNEKKESILNNIKEKIGDSIINLGDKISDLGLNLSSKNIKESNQNNIFSNSQVSIFVKSNEPFSLLINWGKKYKIDWGDGLVSEGEINKSDFVLNHSWQNKGNYQIKLEIEDDKNKDYFNLSVVVY